MEHEWNDERLMMRKNEYVWEGWVCLRRMSTFEKDEYVWEDIMMMMMMIMMMIRALCVYFAFIYIYTLAYVLHFNIHVV
jgi:hypothetical protein